MTAVLSPSELSWSLVVVSLGLSGPDGEDILSSVLAAGFSEQTQLCFEFPSSGAPHLRQSAWYLGWAARKSSFSLVLSGS